MNNVAKKLPHLHPILIKCLNFTIEIDFFFFTLLSISSPENLFILRLLEKNFKTPLNKNYFQAVFENGLN